MPERVKNIKHCVNKYKRRINKISARYLSFIFFVSLTYGIAFTALVCNFAQKHLEHETNKELLRIVVVDSAAVLLSAFLIIIHMLKLNSKANIFATHVIREYLKLAMKEYPELIQYRPILYNPQKLKIMTNYISNALPKDIQKNIVQVIRDSDILNIDGSSFNLPKKYTLKNIKKTVDTISGIIKKHANSDENFMHNLHHMIEIVNRYKPINTTQKTIKIK